MSIDNASSNDWNKANQKYMEEYNGVFPLPEKGTLGEYIKSKQVGGNHYKTSLEPWEVMMAWGLDPWACNVLKYVQRHRKKNGLEDLEKAKHYLEFMIANYEAIGGKYYKD